MSDMKTYTFANNYYLSEFVQHLLNNGYTIRMYKQREARSDDDPDDITTLVEVYKRNEES